MVWLMLVSSFPPNQSKYEASKRFDDPKLDIRAAMTVSDEFLTTSQSYSYTKIAVLDLTTQIALITLGGLNLSGQDESETLKERRKRLGAMMVSRLLKNGSISH